MAFFAPIIAAAVGAGAIGTALISAGISLALGFAARALGPKPKAAAASVGHRLTLRIDPDAPREVLVGTAATAGTLVYHHVYGPNGNDHLQLVFALADCECDALVAIHVDGKRVTWDSSTGDIAEFNGKLNVRFKRGTATDTVPAEFLANSGGRILATDIGAGVAAVYVTATFDETLFPRGEPRMLFVLRGARLYDIRKDSTAGGSGAHRWGQPATWEWTDNAAVITYNFRRGIYTAGQHVGGMNTPALALPASAWIAAANACDEAVALAAGGTEKRYRLNGIFPVPTVHREVLQDLLAACAGREIDSGGTFKLLAGVAQASVMTITDDDLMADGDIEITPRRSRNELVNGVFGSYADPAQSYETIALPPRLSPADELADGGVRLTEHYALDMVTSNTQGQRVLEILRRRGRYQMTVRCRLRSRFAVLEPGDVVTWTSARYGWTSRQFEVLSLTLSEDLQPTLTLAETASSIYAWTVSDEIDPEQPQPLPSGGATLTSISGLTVQNVVVQGGNNTSRPGIHATWTPVTDPTVDSIRFEFRRAGDTIALEVGALDPGAGSYTWVDGVQSAVVYEVRAIPVARPVRPMAWTGWASTGATTSDVVVGAAAAEVQPGSVDVVHLSPQAAFELSLATALETVPGSVASYFAEMERRFERIASAIDMSLEAVDRAETGVWTTQRRLVTERNALAEQITAVIADLDHPTTGLSATATAVATLTAEVDHPTTGLATRASATALTAVSNTVNGVSSSVSQMLSAVNGNLQYNVVLNTNGQWVGWISMDGSEQGTELEIGASLFRIFDPNVGGGTPIQMVKVETINGVPRMAIDGELIARAIEAGSVTATKGSFGVITGLSGNFVFNTETGVWSTATNGVPNGVNYINLNAGFRLGG